MFNNAGSINITCIDCHLINPEIDLLDMFLNFNT